VCDVIAALQSDNGVCGSGNVCMVPFMEMAIDMGYSLWKLFWIGEYFCVCGLLWVGYRDYPAYVCVDGVHTGLYPGAYILQAAIDAGLLYTGDGEYHCIRMCGDYDSIANA
jgi:hypothetical protein